MTLVKSRCKSFSPLRGEIVNKLLLGIIITGALIGCASQEAVEQPKTSVEGKDQMAARQGSETLPIQTKAVGDTAVEVYPQKDLGNIQPNDIRYKHSVYYDYDKYDIRNEFKPLVEAHAKYLIDHADARIAVQGNTDERGSREYNIALGHRRAESVKKMMNVLGVPDKQIETVSFGNEKPKAICVDESCWKENRRSDIVYKP